MSQGIKLDNLTTWQPDNSVYYHDDYHDNYHEDYYDYHNDYCVDYHEAWTLNLTHLYSIFENIVFLVLF